MLQRLLQVMKQRKVTHVLHLGDVKETLNPWDVRVSNFIVRATEEISKRCPFLVLLGNHDRTTMSDESESCLPVMAAAGAQIYEKPGVAVLNKKARLWLYLVPWMRDRKLLLQALADCPRGGIHILAMHADMEDARYNLTSKRLVEDGLTLKDIRHQDYVLRLSGHIHMPQEVQGVTYVGSPFSMDWGECNQSKRFILVSYDGPGPLVIEDIPTELPGLFDPQLPRFPLSRKWLPDDRIRIKVPSSGVQELEKARIKAQAKYPGAIIQVTPVVEGVEQAVPDFKQIGNDEELLKRYLVANPVPDPEKCVAYLKYHLPKGGMYGIPPLKFKQVDAEEALCFTTCQLQLDKPGVTLVTGVNQDWGVGDRSNGAGKTSLLSTPVVALFGTTPKGQSHEAWRRYGAKKPSKVRLEMTLSNGSKLIISRGRKPPLLIATLDDKDQTMGSIPATQAWIERTTGLTWDVLVNALYIGQSEVGTILTGTPKERKQLFSRFLGLERFMTAEEAVRKDVSRTKHFLEETEADLAVVEEGVRRCKQTIAELQSKRVAPDLKGLKQCEDTLTQVEATIKQLQVVVKTEQERRDHYIAKASRWAQRAARCDERRRTYHGQYEKLQALTGTCPVCKGTITAKDKALHLKELYQQSKQAMEEFARFQKQEDLCRSKAVIAVRNVTQAQDELTAAAMQKEELNERVANLVQVVETAKVLDSAIVSQQRDLDECTRKARAHQNCISALCDDMDFLFRCLAVVHRDGVPAFLCASLAPKLNQVAQGYSDVFSENEITVQFTVEAGELDVQVSNIHGGHEVGDQSQGELRMAGLIAAFTLREALVPYNLLVLDEPGDGLDGRNARTFATALEGVAKRFGTLFVTTHNTNILSALTPKHHLEVTKHHGVATVKELL
jgi:DNA repair exonuclease SbcCD ATPase subunit